MGKAESYRDLVIWQMGMETARRVHSLTRSFPREEVYGLTSQMRRAAVSIPSNIAEGFSRHSRREMSRFVAIAHGSVSELETQVTLARDFGYMDCAAHDEIMEHLDHLGRKITLFMRHIGGRQQSQRQV